MEAAVQQAARSGGSSVRAAPQHRISKHGRLATADELEVRTGGGGGTVSLNLWAVRVRVVALFFSYAVEQASLDRFPLLCISTFC